MFHGLIKHAHWHPVGRIFETCRIQNTHHIMRGRIPTDGRKMTITSLQEMPSRVRHNNMKAISRASLPNHVSKCLFAHGTIRIQINSGPITPRQTCCLIQSYPFPLHDIKWDATIQHFFMEYTPRAFPRTPWIY